MKKLLFVIATIASCAAFTSCGSTPSSDVMVTPPESEETGAKK